MNLVKEALSRTATGLRRIRIWRNFFKKKPTGFLRVLIYHDIAPQYEEKFVEQLNMILKKYRVIDIDKFCQMHRGKVPVQEGNILLTFDDGFKSNRIVAEKYLNPLGIKAVFFVIPDFIACQDISKQKEFIANNIFSGSSHHSAVPDHLAPMTWDDIQFLLSHGHTVASHSSGHLRLSSLASSEKLQYELISSADSLQNKLNIPIKYFAYPFGDINSIDAKTLKLAKNRYEYVFSGIRGNNHQRVNPYAIRRDHVEPTFSLKYFQFILEGGLSPYYYFKRKQLDNMV